MIEFQSWIFHHKSPVSISLYHGPYFPSHILLHPDTDRSLLLYLFPPNFRHIVVFTSPSEASFLLWIDWFCFPFLLPMGYINSFIVSWYLTYEWDHSVSVSIPPILLTKPVICSWGTRVISIFWLLWIVAAITLRVKIFFLYCVFYFPITNMIKDQYQDDYQNKHLDINRTLKEKILTPSK